MGLLICETEIHERKRWAVMGALGNFVKDILRSVRGGLVGLCAAIVFVGILIGACFLIGTCVINVT